MTGGQQPGRWRHTEVKIMLRAKIFVGGIAIAGLLGELRFVGVAAKRWRSRGWRLEFWIERIRERRWERTRRQRGIRLRNEWLQRLWRQRVRQLLVLRRLFRQRLRLQRLRQRWWRARRRTWRSAGLWRPARDERRSRRPKFHRPQRQRHAVDDEGDGRRLKPILQAAQSHARAGQSREARQSAK